MVQDSLNKIQNAVPLWLYEASFSGLCAWLCIWQWRDLGANPFCIVSVLPLIILREWNNSVSCINKAVTESRYYFLEQWQFYAEFILVFLVIFIALRLTIAYLLMRKTNNSKTGLTIPAMLLAYVDLYVGSGKPIFHNHINDLECEALAQNRLYKRMSVYAIGIGSFFWILIQSIPDRMKRRKKWKQF